MRRAGPGFWKAVVVGIVLGWAGGALAAETLPTVVDDLTGVRLGLPPDVVRTARDPDYGRNWRTPNGRLSIAALKYSGRRLDDVYDKLRKVAGRRISRDVHEADRFVLEGTDRDGSAFYLDVRRSGGEVRGLSVVYERDQAHRVPAIVAAFDAFPATLSPVVAAAPLTVVVDERTGLRLGIPADLVRGPTAREWGSNWSSPDRSLEIDTIHHRDLTLREWYDRLKRIDGRLVTRDTISERGFVLEGSDRDGSRFRVEGVVAPGGIRGVSVVRAARAADRLAVVAARIGASVELVPPVVASTGAPPRPPLPPDVQGPDAFQGRLDALEERLREAERHTSLIELNRQLEEERRRLLQELEAARRGQDHGPVAPLPGRRVAFVVGINAYESLTPLQTAVNDARLIGRTLREQGFEVMVVEDATRRQFNATWQRFLDTVRPDVFAMVFFAGHGVQMDGVNFLIPRDAPNPAVAEKELLKKETINFAELMDELGGRAPAVSLYVLDACRSNPYAGAARRGLGTRGLSPTDPAKGAFVMYSAGAGEDAWDSLPDDPPGAGNSVYTRRLVPLLKTPGLSFQALALRVRSEVQQLLGQHGHAQTPAYYDNLSGTVCFTGGCGGQAKL